MFGFGASSARSQSQSTSLDFGVQGSESASLSEGFAQSTTGGQSTTQQSIAFEELFKKLFQGASGAAATVAEAAPILQGEAAQLFSGGLGFLEQLQGPDAYTDARLAGPDAAAAGQLDALKTGLGDLFRDELNPAITSSGVRAGTYGGARTGVAQSLAAREVGSRYAVGASQILANSQAQRDTLATTSRGQTLDAAGTGLASLPQLLGLSQAGANASLDPYLALSQILGGPTVLSQQQSTQFGQSTSADIARAMSESFGFNFGTSQSTSTSKSKSFNVGVSAGGGKS